MFEVKSFEVSPFEIGLFEVSFFRSKLIFIWSFSLSSFPPMLFPQLNIDGWLDATEDWSAALNQNFISIFSFTNFIEKLRLNIDHKICKGKKWQKQFFYLFTIH